MPAGDVLIHTGDIMLRSNRCRCCCGDLRGFARFMRRQPHEHKVAIAGNHDRSVLQLGPDGMHELLQSGETSLVKEGAPGGGEWGVCH